ncbi:hypothetical protein CSAL01_04510 [Colletotrichum salicis]|uniref:Uncharacterized protein n=1 Tax=Colletotrichum salicis TaxID=1209931 RepID=A0A135RVM7_9PEZI|nr:hypothetical protein CSAL01_04510 [Colletotrichum salicis]
MANLDLASTVDTWVAAFLALLALGVFVGPFFVWRANQTERHKALDKLEKGEAEGGGFVSKSLRLFRRVRVPELSKEPQFSGRQLVGSGEARTVSPESAGWIQLCLLIKAHGVDMSLSDPLAIDEEKTVATPHVALPIYCRTIPLTTRRLPTLYGI